MREKADRLQRAAENWERGAEGERRIGAILDQLPPEYVVYHDLQLPGSKANVDHLVVAPGGIWAIDTKNYSYPITHGTGRGVGKLWAGKRPIDERIRTAQWEASVVAELIGHPVEPMLCIIAPSLPRPSFDHAGVRICGPSTVSTELDRVVDPTDVGAAVAAVQHAFGAAPAARSDPVSPTHVAPKPAERPPGPASRAGVPWEPRQARRRRISQKSRPARRRRVSQKSRPARRQGSSRSKQIAAERSGGMGEVLKVLVVLAGLWIAVVVIQSDGFRNVTSAVFGGAATHMADRARERAEEAASSRSTTSVATSSTTSTTVPAADPPAVAYTVACAPDGDLWDVSWVWPGPPPAGVAGYGVATRRQDGPLSDHTTEVWRSPESGKPAVMQVPVDTNELAILTQYRAADGVVLAETEEPFRVPSLRC